MKLTVATVITVGFVAVRLFHTLGACSTLAAQETQSVWDGVYTEEQAKRGDPLYAQQCASCHGSDLMGGETAPGLISGEFRANWDGLSVGDLFQRVRVSMPQGTPGSLTREQYADILAFVFFRGDFPVGKTELPTRPELLSQIRFEAWKPQ